MATKNGENKDTSGTAGTVYGDGKLAKLRKQRDTLLAQSGVYSHRREIDKLNYEILQLTNGKSVSSVFLSGDIYQSLNNGGCQGENFGAIIH